MSTTPPAPATSPMRVVRSRKRGSRLPPNTVCVTRPGKFGNPFHWKKAREVGYRGTDEELRAFAVSIFREWVEDGVRHGYGFEKERQRLLSSLPDLRGKNLACWCPAGSPCHADVLLELANTTEAPNAQR